MTLTLDIPAELAEHLGINDPSELPRVAPEALALDGFLKQHGIELGYTWEDLELERAAFRQAGIDS